MVKNVKSTFNGRIVQKCISSRETRDVKRSESGGGLTPSITFLSGNGWKGKVIRASFSHLSPWLGLSYYA